jgi:ABC-type antimicrobial peptide transport system permease subunit
MIRNYFIIALRNLWRNRLVTIINLVGMAMGFSIFLAFWTWVLFNVSFDRFHDGIDDMYMLHVTFSTENGSEFNTDRSGGIFAQLLVDQFAQVEGSCRVSQPQHFELGIPVKDTSLGYPMKYQDESQVLAVDSNFFHFYTFPLLEGDVDLIFSERNHMVITESLARKIFGDESAMGRQIKIGEGGYFEVAGIAADPPPASSFQFNALLGFHVLEELGFQIDGYGGNLFYSNFRIRPGTDIAALNNSINELVEENTDLEINARFFLDPFRRMHLYGENSQITGLLINLIMALVILFIAVINFINLTTASYSGRLREIAIRKSAGAGKRQLIMQFMGETYLLLLLAFYLGLFLAEQIIPPVNRAFGSDTGKTFYGEWFWVQMAGLYLLTGLLAGLYPAIKISGFRPWIILSGKSSDPYRGSSRTRKVLIVIQFIFSIIFIIVSMMMIRQYNYLKEADLGFNREEVIYIRTKGLAWDRYPLIRNELEALHFVYGVSSGSEVPVMVQTGEFDWGEREGEHNRLAAVLRTDAGFASTFEIGMTQGEYFNKERDSLNHQYAVINQKLADMMGWEEAVGRKFYFLGEDLTILGVTENINFFPFNMDIFQDKALIYIYQEVGAYIFIRVAPRVASDQLADIEKIFQKYNAGYEYEHDFVSGYEYPAIQDRKGLQIIFNLFSAFAVFIAIMGLIGLSYHNSQHRTKEVGIRKSMGANTGMVMQLLLSDFLKLVLLSNLIALPASYLIVRRLLRIFSYSIDQNAGAFLLALMLSMVITLGTVSFHAFRTARSNPVDSLRYE